MKYKVMALDIDGTLLNSDKAITEKTGTALLAFEQNGGKIILASGRPICSMIPYAETLELAKYGGCMLAYNGGCAVDGTTGNVMFQTVLPRQYIPEICGIIRKYPVGIGCYHKDTVIVGNEVNLYTRNAAERNRMKIQYVEDFPKYAVSVHKCLLQGEPEVILELENILSEKYKDKLGIFRSEPYFLEIVPNGTDKGTALDKLLKHIGYDRKECIACGDGFNDISMIQYAGLGVAMANAGETVRKAADFITLSNDSDGIAYVLETIAVRNCILPKYIG